MARTSTGSGPGHPPVHREERSGGVPDGLLIGGIAFLLGVAFLTWTATGLAGLFTHGSWPHGVSLPRTPSALRELAGSPQDLAGAWPDTPPAELSGYGLFWGLLISELLVLVVLGVFVLGVVTRGRAVRRRAREERQALQALQAPGNQGDPRAARPTAPPASAPTPTPTPAPAPAPVPAPNPVPVPAGEPERLVPAPRAAGTPVLLYATAAERRPTAVQAVLDAPGAVLVVTSDPTVWAETKDARAKLGPVLVHDPGHLCDTPARLHWSPTAGCEQPEVAAARAAAFLAPVRPQARIDEATTDTAQTLLQCWLHAAATDGRPFRQVHRWAMGGGAQEAVRLLRTHPKAASGLAGLLESALTAHPERRRAAQELTARALSALTTVHVREACTPNRADTAALGSFASEGGTLYVVGESIEDPRHQPGAMPLLTALASHVVEHGRRLAARSTDGRLDPPLTLVLDDVAAVAPLPCLPELLTTGERQGLVTLAMLRSPEQARARWRTPLTPPAV
ncbi:type IV secretory system conjugative DNA transfer family protein [Streptomyces sp. NBC_00102]|uniref:type IV secretory system conjugative DNA transfer family protein n=1 Tax=Streptomyces sp. NBC_00102 TaxID=2975652 RepID=UPI002258D3AC|nr:type IV secretory system conjugative DNA transfer family protein [Streptomyces sp. NBC_00102]MCX5398036.1 type IV secretory system conjugative DNA transfer family protein [Streptomyces sp. NBC_00102]